MGDLFGHQFMQFMLVNSYIGAAFAMGNMEEQSGHENPLQLMSFSFGGSINDASYVPKDDPSHHFTRGSGKNENPPNALYLSQWIHGQPTSHNYVKFLEESSTFPHKAPAKDIVDAIPLPVGSLHAVNGVSEIPSEVLYNSLANACGFKLADPSLSYRYYALWIDILRTLKQVNTVERSPQHIHCQELFLHVRSY